MNKFIIKPEPAGRPPARMKGPRTSSPGAPVAAIAWALLISTVALGQASGPSLKGLASLALFPYVAALGGPGAVFGICLLQAILALGVENGKSAMALGLIGILLAGLLGAANGGLGLWLLQRDHSTFLDRCLPFCVAGAAGGFAAGIQIARSLRRWRTES